MKTEKDFKNFETYCIYYWYFIDSNDENLAGSIYSDIDRMISEKYTIDAISNDIGYSIKNFLQLNIPDIESLEKFDNVWYKALNRYLIKSVDNVDYSQISNEVLLEYLNNHKDRKDIRIFIDVCSD